MKRRILSLLLTAALCLLLTVPCFAAGGTILESPYFNPTAIIICLLLGFLIAFIPMGALKGQINNVHRKTEAEDYSRKGSMNLQVKQDQFLRADLVRVPIPKNNQPGRPNNAPNSRR